MSYDIVPEIRCQCGHLVTDHLWAGKGKIKRCQKKKCHCLKFNDPASQMAANLVQLLARKKEKP